MPKLCYACMQICAFAYYSAPLYYITEKALRVHHKPFYIRVPCRYPVGEHYLSLHPCSLASVTGCVNKTPAYQRAIQSKGGDNPWIVLYWASEALPARAAPSPPKRSSLKHHNLACTLGMAGCGRMQHVAVVPSHVADCHLACIACGSLHQNLLGMHYWRLFTW